MSRQPITTPLARIPVAGQRIMSVSRAVNFESTQEFTVFYFRRLTSGTLQIFHQTGSSELFSLLRILIGAMSVDLVSLRCCRYFSKLKSALLLLVDNITPENA